MYHDLDDGMRPISVLFPYLPTAFHRRRDAARERLTAVFRTVIDARRASGVREDDMLQARFAPRCVCCVCLRRGSARTSCCALYRHAGSDRQPVQKCVRRACYHQ